MHTTAQFACIMNHRQQKDSLGRRSRKCNVCIQVRSGIHLVSFRYRQVSSGIVQLISAIAAAVRFLHCCLSVAMSFSVIRCLPAVFSLHTLLTPARRRSSSIQSIHLLFGRRLDLFPVAFHWCTLLVSLSSFIRNTCPSHFNRILLDTGSGTSCVICLIVSFVILSLYVISIILLIQRFSQASIRFSVCLARVHDSFPYIQQSRGFLRSSVCRPNNV